MVENKWLSLGLTGVITLLISIYNQYLDLWVISPQLISHNPVIPTPDPHFLAHPFAACQAGRKKK